MDGEKVTQIIKLFSEGKTLDDVAKEVGYAQTNSISRFMSKYDYKWNKEKQNYVYEGNENYKSNEEVIKKENKTNTDVLDLLESKDVVDLLTHAKKVLNLINSSIHAPQENLWKKAQKYLKSNEPAITKSFRFTLDIENKINQFSNETNLNQKQIVCVALEEFFEKHY
jgi:hypothetical protein